MVIFNRFLHHVALTLSQYLLPQHDEGLSDPADGRQLLRAGQHPRVCGILRQAGGARRHPRAQLGGEGLVLRLQHR